MNCGECGCPDYWHEWKGVVEHEIVPEGARCLSSVDNDHYCRCSGFRQSKIVFPPRPDWDHYFIDVAKTIATRSTCNRVHVGVVVTDADHHIVVTGYNGAPPHQPHCPPDESQEPNDHCERSLHAENNVVVQSALTGRVLANCTWYLYPFGPCVPCQRNFIVPTHATRVVFPRHYRLPFTTNYGIETLETAGVVIDVLSDVPVEVPYKS